jgi:hypothetical protein
MISPRALIVACSTRPMGAMMACGIWRAAAVPNLGMHHLLKGRCVMLGALVVPSRKHVLDVNETVGL